MIDRLYRLRHNAIIGSNNQDCNIGNISTSCTHCGKCLVSRCIQERDIFALILHLICTDMLGNSAGFSGSNMGIADSVQNRSLTVVNVTHNNNNRATLFSIFGIIIFFNQALFNGDDYFVLYLCTKFLCHQARCIKVNFFIDCCHYPKKHQSLDNFCCSYLQPGCKFSYGNHIRNPYTKLLLSGTLQFQSTQLILLCFPFVGILLTATLCRLLVDFLLFGGILIPTILSGRGNLLIPLIVLIQINIRASGIDRATLFCGNTLRRCHLHLYMKPFPMLLCLGSLFLGLAVFFLGGSILGLFPLRLFLLRSSTCCLLWLLALRSLCFLPGCRLFLGFLMAPILRLPGFLRLPTLLCFLSLLGLPAVLCLFLGILCRLFRLLLSRNIL